MTFVLVVDDHTAVAEAVAALVRGWGMEAERVDSGAAALAFIAERPVDFVVLDVSMPGMSGFDVLRALHAPGRPDDAPPPPPVVMFSANDGAEHRAEALQLGAAAFVSKAEPDALLPLIRRHARGARAPAPEEPSGTRTSG